MLCSLIEPPYAPHVPTKGIAARRSPEDPRMGQSERRFRNCTCARACTFVLSERALAEGPRSEV